MCESSRVPRNVPHENRPISCLCEATRGHRKTFAAVLHSLAVCLCIKRVMTNAPRKAEKTKKKNTNTHTHTDTDTDRSTKSLAGAWVGGRRGPCRADQAELILQGVDQLGQVLPRPLGRLGGAPKSGALIFQLLYVRLESGNPRQHWAVRDATADTALLPSGSSSRDFVLAVMQQTSSSAGGTGPQATSARIFCSRTAWQLDAALTSPCLLRLQRGHVHNTVQGCFHLARMLLKLLLLQTAT